MEKIVAWLRTRQGIAAVAVVLVLALIAGVWTLSRGGDDVAAAQPGAEPTSSGPSASPGETPTPSQTPTPTTPTCEGPNTQFNVEGIEQDSLLPDCGQTPVSRAQQARQGLGLACGGSYPVILYKTTTSGTKSSICGKTSAGEPLRVVVKPAGGAVRDLKGYYEYEIDAFVAKDGDTTYVVQAYDGTVLTKRNGSTTTEASEDWISLDNEPDGD